MANRVKLTCPLEAETEYIYSKVFRLYEEQAKKAWAEEEKAELTRVKEKNEKQKAQFEAKFEAKQQELEAKRKQSLKRSALFGFIGGAVIALLISISIALKSLKVGLLIFPMATILCGSGLFLLRFSLMKVNPALLKKPKDETKRNIPKFTYLPLGFILCSSCSTKTRIGNKYPENTKEYNDTFFDAEHPENIKPIG